MKSKYNAQKVTVDDIKFDSRKEAARYEVLKGLQLVGKIDMLELQPRFEVLEGYRYKGKAIRKVEYVADFKYLDMERGVWVVEDVKGMRTDVYRLKLKMFLRRYGDFFDFVEV